MILVDTSVWVDHLRRGHPRLREALLEGQVVTHPFVIGELACGNLRQREEVLGLLRALPQVPVAEHTEVLQLVERRKLFGRGIGWIDAHLLAAALLSRCTLLTLDRQLASVAAELR